VKALIKIIVVVIGIVLLSWLVFDLWNTGAEMKRYQALADDNGDFAGMDNNPGLYGVPRILMNAYLLYSPDKNSPNFSDRLLALVKNECSFKGKTDLVPCVKALSPNKEISSACSSLQLAFQEYRKAIVSSNEILLGLGKYEINLAGIKSKEYYDFEGKQTKCLNAVEDYYKIK